VSATLAPHLEQDMTVEPAGLSAAVRLHVPKLDRQLPASSQVEQIHQGLDAASRLTGWAIMHARLLSNI
jgi:hypothetical protein